MKKFILLLVINFSLVAVAVPNLKDVKTEEDDADEPRAVWVFSFDEFNMLRTEQKEKFIKDFATVSKDDLFLNKIPELKSVATLKEALAFEGEWQKVENQINKYCQNINNTDECERIALPRDEALLEYRVRK